MTAAASLILNGKQRGFTYVSVVILVATIGLVAATSLRLGSTLQRAAAEQELLRIGMEFSNALASYAAATPEGQPNFPPSLKELLRDPRFPQTRRHLRRIYVDPLTGTQEWGLVQATDKGGILAVYSLAKGTPVKIGNFPVRFAAFEGKTNFADWKFSGEGVQVPGTKPGAEPMPGEMKPGDPMQPGLPPKPGQPPAPGQPMTSGQPQQPAKPGTVQEPQKPDEPEPEPPQEPQEPPEEPAPGAPPATEPPTR